MTPMYVLEDVSKIFIVFSFKEHYPFTCRFKYKGIIEFKKLDPVADADMSRIVPRKVIFLKLFCCS